MNLPSDYHLLLHADLYSFTERTFYEVDPSTQFHTAPYLEVIASKLSAVADGRIKRLIINVPPRHLKSISASVAFVAWLLGRLPHRRVICASYGQDLADNLSRSTRKVMQAEWYQQVFRTRLSERTAVNDFETLQGGGRMATSVGGVLTGRGADLIVIDDPLKPDDALSEVNRKRVNEWYDGTLVSRLNDKENGAIVIVMQRLHQDDLVAHVQAQEPWEVLSLPAIAEVEERHQIEDLLGSRVYFRNPGDILLPARESAVTLANIRRTIGEYNFQAQYQQSPTPRGGAMFKRNWIQYYDASDKPEHFFEIVQSWDTANKVTELSDYCVCTTWGRNGHHIYLLQVFRAKLEYPDLVRAAKHQAELFKPHCILIEDKASGTQLIQDFKRQGIGRTRPVEPPPGMDKVMRAHAQTIMFENGKVFLPKSAPWLTDYLHELLAFPGSKHDDQVDSTTQALEYMKGLSKFEIWTRLGK